MRGSDPNLVDRWKGKLPQLGAVHEYLLGSIYGQHGPCNLEGLVKHGEIFYRVRTTADAYMRYEVNYSVDGPVIVQRVWSTRSDSAIRTELRLATVGTCNVTEKTVDDYRKWVTLIRTAKPQERLEEVHFGPGSPFVLNPSTRRLERDVHGSVETFDPESISIASTAASIGHRAAAIYGVDRRAFIERSSRSLARLAGRF
ncbi:hypothetical protein JCM10212_001414 [Sporobolomyces blumeae]